MKYAGIWQEMKFEDQHPRTIRFGDKSLSINRMGQNWQIGLGTSDPQEMDSLWSDSVNPENQEFDEYITEGKSSFRLKPSLPDKALVISPLRPFNILPGEKVTFFLTLPVWIGLSVNNKSQKEIQLKEFPVSDLSQTWFGDSLGGELCYGLQTELYSDWSPLYSVPWKAVCPLTISNKSPEILPLSRLCLRVVYLSLYATKRGYLWTNEVKVQFKGPDQVSQITFGQKAPDFEKGLSHIRSPRETPDKSIIKKSFGFFRGFSHY